MGITIDYFTHRFQRDATPSAEVAQALHSKLYAADDCNDVWGIFPVVDGAIDWRGCPERRLGRMYGLSEAPAHLCNDVTGYLVIYVSQDRGFAVWGEEGWRELEHDKLKAAEESYRDFCALVGRLIEANEIRRQHCC